MSKLIVHAGSNKTGTSSIQRALADNCELIKEKGIIYPSLFRDEAYNSSHHPIAEILRTNDINQVIAAAESIKKTMDDNNCNTSIISSELFYPTDPKIDLSGLVSEFQEIVVITYLRDAFSYYNSWWQQNVIASGNTSRFEEFIWSQRYSNYSHAADRILGLSKHSNIRLIFRPFQLPDLHNNDVVDDFFHSIGLYSVVDNPGFKRKSYFQNPSICGNLLFFRMLMALSSGTAVKRDYSDLFWDLAKATDPNSYIGSVAHPNLNASFLPWFESINKRTAELTGINIRIRREIDVKKQVPYVPTLSEDLENIMQELHDLDKEIYLHYRDTLPFI
jgi:hypothetical protein